MTEMAIELCTQCPSLGGHRGPHGSQRSQTRRMAEERMPGRNVGVCTDHTSMLPSSYGV